MKIEKYEKKYFTIKDTVKIKEKFYLQTDKMDPTTVQTILGNYIPEHEMNELIQLLYRCDAGRFSPQTVTFKSDIIPAAISILKKITIYLTREFI